MAVSTQIRLNALLAEVWQKSNQPANPSC